SLHTWDCRKRKIVAQLLHFSAYPALSHEQIRHQPLSSTYGTAPRISTTIAWSGNARQGVCQMPKPARIIVVILLATGCSARLRADPISVFTISGTDISSCLSVAGGMPIPGCAPTFGEFVGALEVDATTGTPIAMDILSTNFFDFRNMIPGIDFNFRPGLVAGN